jgi:uncharacterized protein (TIGR03435 family)
MVYAGALAQLEELRGGIGEPALAATGGDLLARIRRLMGQDLPDRRNLGPAGAALAAALVLGIAIAAASAPAIRAQPPAPRAAQAAPVAQTVTIPAPPVQAAQIQAAPNKTPPVQTAAPQPPAATTPKFDVASIRPCDPNEVPPGGRGGGRATGSFRVDCVNVMTLIERAYVRFADGRNRSPMLTSLTKIEGGPAWIRSDLYTIEAAAEGAPAPMMKDGPMMQALLEDRFRLKIRRETREVPAYSLTPARGGSKLQPAKLGNCTAADFIDAPFPPLPVGTDDRQCKFFWNANKGPNRIVAARSSSVEDFTAFLTRIMDRRVFDKTGVTELVDFRLVFAPDDTTPGIAALRGVPDAPSDDPAGASIFTALQQQLGLKLESIKGPREYLVIDHVERPSEN